MREFERNLNTQVQEISGKLLQMEVDMEVERWTPYLQIFIRCQGRCMVLSVQEDETVFDVKSRILDREGIPTDQQLLIYASQQLEDDRKLSDYFIGRDATLHLVFRLQAGMLGP